MIEIDWPVDPETTVPPTGYSILRRSSPHKGGYEDLLCLEGESLLRGNEEGVVCDSRVLCTYEVPRSSSFTKVRNSNALCLLCSWHLKAEGIVSASIAHLIGCLLDTKLDCRHTGCKSE